MYEKVKAYIKEHNMIQAQDGILAGVSGGGDSMAMLAILKRYQKEVPFSLYVVHVHHGIRGEEADRDENVVKELCKKWELPFFPYHYDVPKLAKEWKTGLEEAGRKVRQEAFKKTQEALPQKMQVRIALAHNENDVAETLIHNLCRGTGLRGLASIQPVRENIIRPILCLNKKEIVNYLSEEKIPYVTDSTNLEDEYTRNRIRHHILPLAESEVSTRVVSHMCQTADILSETEDYLRQQTDAALKGCVTRRKERLEISADDFLKYHPALRKRILLRLLEEISPTGKDISALHVGDALVLLEKDGNRSIDLPYDICVRREYGHVFIYRKGQMEQRELPELDYSEIFLINGEEVPKNKYTKWFDYAKMKESPTLRFRQTGDYLTLSDGKGRIIHKSLKDYMVTEKIPRELRDRIPVLAEGSHVIWLIGYRISEYYKVDSNTKHVLQVRLITH